MAVLWIIVLVMSLYFVVVFAGSALLRVLVFIVSIFTTPFKSLAGLYKSGQRRKAVAMTVALVFLFVLIPLFFLLLSLIVD